MNMHQPSQVLAGRMSPTIIEHSPVIDNQSDAHDRLSGTVARVATPDRGVYIGLRNGCAGCDNMAECISHAGG